MAKTIDDLYDKIVDLIDAVKNGGASSSYSGNGINDIDDVLDRLKKRLDGLTDNLDEYNTTFERDILANQQKNAKELEKLQREYIERFEKFKEKHAAAYQAYSDEIEKAKKVLSNKNSTADERSQARKDIANNQGKIDRLDQQFEKQKTAQRKRSEINNKRREIGEDEEDLRRAKNTRLGRNMSKVKDASSDMRFYGKQMQSIGGKMGGKFGGAISKAGAGLTKFAGALGKAVPVIGWVITALQLLGDAAKAVAEADAELQDIQNERNTARTNRNIERSKIDTQSLIDRLETATANGLATFETESNYVIGQQNVANMKSIAEAQVKTGSITNGYNAAAWDALNSQLDIEAESQKVGLRYQAESAKTKRANVLRNLELRGREQVRDVDKKLVDQDLREKETELDKRDRDYTREHPFATTATRMAGSSTNADNVYNPGGRAYGTVESANKTSIETAATMGAIESISLLGDVVSPFTDAAYTKQDTLAKQRLVNERNQLNSLKAVTENTAEMANAIKSSSNQLADAMTNSSLQIQEATVDTVNTIKKTYAQFAQTIENWTLNFEKISLDSATSKGITTDAQAQDYSRFMNKTVQTVSKWGLNEQDVIAMQNQYGQGTGRSILGTTTDIDKTAAMGKYLGDNGLAVELSNSTEIFNMGMSTTMELMWDMTKKVNKMGLDGRKYMKDMTQNLKMAQKYNFKGGVKGMMEMAKWAQNVRFDMNKLPGLLEDILNGGLEGIIEKGAKLQVLGGNFAMGADPLAMMYEAMEDPAALAKRINSMTEGMGTFNSKTGQVEFNGMEQRQLQLLAQYTGQDLTDVKNQASYGIKSAKMGNIFNSDLDEDQKASLVNKAYLKDGEWKVNDFKGNELNVSEVTAEMMDDLQADTHEGFVEQALKEIVSWQDKDNGLTTELQAKISQALVEEGEYRKNQEERHNKQLEELSKIDGWKNKVAGYWNSATTAFKAIKEDIDSPDNLQTKALNELNAKFAISNALVKKIAGKLGAEVSSLNLLGKSKVNTQSYEKVNPHLELSYRPLTDANGQQKRNANGELLYDTSKPRQHIIAANDAIQPVNRIEHIPRTPKINDGTMDANGQSMAVAASKVTPINDGQIATTSPQDHAIFAKTGGPFDTLFNGIFAKINEISSVLPRSMEYIMPLERIFNEISYSKGTANNSKIQIDTVKIELNGKLELSNSNGQSVDIINEIKNNPILIRTLTQLISESMKKNLNGGKSSYTGGIATPRFN